MPYGMTYNNIKDLSSVLSIHYNIPEEELIELLTGPVTKDEVKRIAANQIINKERRI